MIDLRPITPPAGFPALAPEGAFSERSGIIADMRRQARDERTRFATIGQMTTTDPVAMTRRCFRCLVVKPLTDFVRNQGNCMGREYECRGCSSTRKRDQRAAS